MRINNTSVDTVASQTAAPAPKVGPQKSQLSTSRAALLSNDQATLSSATNLVALAKSATATSRQAKISALSEQLRSGSYHGSTARAGQAMVQELLQRGMSGLPQ